MREYRPKRSVVLVHGALVLLCLGMGMFAVLSLLRMWRSPDWQAQFWLYVPVLLPIGAAAAACAWLLVSSLATYRVDPQGITRIVTGKQQLLLWRDVVDAQSGRSGLLGMTWTLTDSGGRKLKVHVAQVERSYGLEGFLHAYTAPVREHKRAQLPLSTQVYRLGKSMGTLMLVCGLLFLCFLVGAFVASPVHAGTSWLVLLTIYTVIVGGFGVVALGMATYYFTYAIRVTPEAITESSLFSNKTLPFDRIAAFYTGDVQMHNGQMQLVTGIVGQNGKKIKFNTQLIDYDTLTATLRSSMESHVLEQGQQEKAAAGRSARRQQARIMIFVGSLLVLLSLVMAPLFCGDALISLKRQNRLDRDGSSTRGIVTGRASHRQGRSNSIYSLDFEFAVAGKTYQRTSPVTWADYDSIPNGSPTSVIYVPSDPTISRMAASVGKSQATGELARYAVYLLLAIPTGVYAVFWGRKLLRAENETGGTTV